MKRISAVIWIIIIGLALWLIIWIKSKYQSSQKYNWEITLEYNKQPYDLDFFKQTLSVSNGFKVCSKPIQTALTQNNSTYLFIGNKPYYTQEAMDSLLQWINSGNTGVIIANLLPDTLLNLYKETYGNLSINNFYESKATSGFYGNTSDTICALLRSRYIDAYNIASWNYFDVNNLEYLDTQMHNLHLGWINQMINLIKIPLGKGYLFIHCNPILFTNYFFRTKEGYHYTNAFLNKTGTKNIIYDYYSHNKIDNPISLRTKSPTPLSYILSQKSLKYAWYLIITIVILFVLFYLKRKQNVIPIQSLKKNKTMHLIELISNLHLLRGNHAFAAQQRMKHWIDTIQQRTNIKLTDAINDDKIKIVANTLKSNYLDIKNLLEYYNQHIKNQKKINTKTFIQFIKLMNLTQIKLWKK